MDRRHFLAAAAAGVSVSVAGCVDAFESLEGTTYGREPPLVSNRPNAIYWPTHTEQMYHGEVAQTSDGLDVHLMYTFPHRFWQVESTDEGYGARIFEVGPNDAIHIMIGVWDHETEVILPVSSLDVAVTGGNDIDERETIYPMLSQRMGFHYGDNYHLDGDDTYTVEVTVGGVDSNRFGDFEGRFEQAETVTMELDYDEAERNNLDFELYEDRQGERGAVAPMGMEDGDMDHGEMDEMDHEEMDHHDMHHQMPLGFAHDLSDAGGSPMGDGLADDIRYQAALFDEPRFGDDPYLAVTAATRYNDLSIPELGLDIRVGPAEGTETVELPVESDEDEDDDDETEDGASTVQSREISVVTPEDAVLAGRLEPGLDPELGFHYGIAAPEITGNESVTLEVTTPTQFVRHEGYETVFFHTPTVTLE